MFTWRTSTARVASWQSWANWIVRVDPSRYQNRALTNNGRCIGQLGCHAHKQPEVHDFYRAAPGGVRTTQAFSQSNKYTTLDMDRAGGVIRDKENAFSQDGGLAVLFGNIAEDGCVKTAGVDESILKFQDLHMLKAKMMP